MQQAETGPRRTGYVIAIVVFLLGVVGAVALTAVFFFVLIGLGDDLDRFVAPGTSQIELEETGNYVLFYEYESRIDGRSFSTDRSPPQIDVEIERVADGAQIDISRSRGETTYSLRNYSGEAIREFSIDEAGAYEFTVTYADGSDEPEFVLAYGEGLGWTLITSIGAFLGAGILFCTLTLVAIAIVAITFFRRYRFDQDRRVTTNSQP